MRLAGSGYKIERIFAAYIGEEKNLINGDLGFLE